MLGLSGQLGKGTLGKFALAEPEVGGTFVPHEGVIRAADSADAAQAQTQSLRAVAIDTADIAQSEVLTLGAVSTVTADGVEAEVTDG